MVYEHLTYDAFKCERRKEFTFADADFYDNRFNHEIEYPLYVKCALIIKMRTDNQNEAVLKQCITRLDATPTVKVADIILQELAVKRILY